MKNRVRNHNFTEKQKKILAVIFFIAFLVFCGLVTWFIGRPMINFVSEPEKFRTWVDSHGIFGEIAFVAMMFFQVVVAFVPGEPLEIGAGYAFGAIEGTILCEIGITLGSIVVFTLVRKFGIKFVEIFFSREKIQSLKFLRSKKSRNIITFLVFFLPGTPKDLLTYFVGLTDIKLSHFLWLTSVARLPSVITSTVGGNALGGEKYIFAIIVFALTLIFSGLGLLIYNFIAKKRNKKKNRTDICRKGKNMLETRELVKIYKPKKGVPVKALDKVSIKFPEVGMVFLLGKSGSGKSTLLNVLGGLDKYNDGEIIIKGVSSKKFHQKHFDSYRNTYVGFIFQEYNVLDDFTVGANIALAIELQGRKAKDGEINKILKEVDLEGYGQRKPNELSGGQKQRVAIARALVKNPQIIMADEPTGALDSVTGKQVFETLKKLSKEKLVIVVSHDREFAENYADRIIELSDGKVISDVEINENAETAEEKGITFSENTVNIPAEYHLTEADRVAINNYIDKLKSGAVQLNISAKSGTNKKFIKTDESKIKFRDSSAFKLIKSKLPLRSAFKIGASSLKYKKIRLVITIILSCISFGLFGLSDTFGAYNHVETCTNSLIDTEVKYIATAKSKKYMDGNMSYWDDYGYKLSASDLEEMKKNTSIQMHGVYVPLNEDMSFSRHLNPNVTLNETNYNIYSDSFTGFCEIDEDTLLEMGFSILAGVLPDGNKNEIAISEYIFEVFKKGQYTDGVVHFNKKGEEYYNYKKIEKYVDILGKTLEISGTKYTVTAVVDTNFNFERYEDLGENKEHYSEAEELLNYVLSNEFDTSYRYSYTGAVMTGRGFVEKIVATQPNIAPITNGFLDFNDNENQYINPQHLARFSDVANEKIIWINGEKKTFSNKDIIVTSDLLNNWYAYDAATEEERKQYIGNTVEEIRRKNNLNLYKQKTGEVEGATENGYKIAGIIDTENSKMFNAVVCNNELYETFTDGSDNYYSFAVGTAPKKRNDLKKLVAYCYREDADIRYEIQNSVTFELDAINEVLKQCSKIFFYIGLGFAAFAALMLANFISTSISYKKQEIGILRAIGSRGNDVFRIFFAESFIIAVINFILSAVGVFAATTLLNYLLRNEMGILITILNFGPRQIILLFLVSVVVAFIASYIPVKKIASKRPIDAIRDR